MRVRNTGRAKETTREHKSSHCLWTIKKKFKQIYILKIPFISLMTPHAYTVHNYKGQMYEHINLGSCTLTALDLFLITKTKVGQICLGLINQRVDNLASLNLTVNTT